LECRRPKVRNNTIDAAGTHGVNVQWQTETYLDSTGRTMRFVVDGNMIAGFVNRGVLVDMSGVAGAAYSVGSISRNQIFGDAANVGIALVGSVEFEKIFIDDNLIQNALIPLYTVGATMAASCRYRGNTGFLTEASGTSTVTNGNTSVVVSHGLGDSIYKALTPTAGQLRVVPTNNLGNATKFWVSNFTTTQFTINVDANPGTDTATFGWSIRANAGF
jgi:aconitase A